MRLKSKKASDRGHGGLSETLIPALIFAYLFGPLFLILSLFFSVRDRLLDPVGYESVKTGDEAIEKMLAAIR